MTTDLDLLSLTQLQRLDQSQHENRSALNPSSCSWMLSSRKQSGMAQTVAQDDDDSWEVRAFEEDTNQAMGTTWPPRSYTCTFCMREFKSAQALGGHMNVHRRDRVRLHQRVQPGSNITPFNDGTISPSVIFPTQDYMMNGGVCILYALPSPNSGGSNGGTDQDYSRPAMSQFQSSNLEPYIPTSIDFSEISRSSIISSRSHSSNIKSSASIDYCNYQYNSGTPTEELDLELRLGRNSSRS